MMNLCACGCGNEAGIYTKTNSKIGAKKGEPRRYIYGHNSRKQIPHRFCIFCGKKIERTIFKSGREEDPSIHRKRKFCSPECSSNWHSGMNATNWKGGKRIDQNGYIYILVGKEHPLVDPYGYALEHRVVAFNAYGPIVLGKIVHHKNGNKHDNHLQNLELMVPGDHSRLHNTKREWNEIPKGGQDGSFST